MREQDKLEGLKEVLTKIQNNSTDGQALVFSHKEVRIYARGILAIFDSLNINSKVSSELLLLIEMLASTGLNHYDRSYLAGQALNVLSKNDYWNKRRASEENF